MSITKKVAEAEATVNTCLYFALAALVMGITFGLLGGWWLWRPRPTPTEAPAAAVQLTKSGAVAIERKPEAVVPPKIAAAVKELNRKAKLTRAATITVQPTQAGCDAIDIELGVVKLPDDTSRVVVRSDDATVTGGVDIPTAKEQVVKELKWAAGASYDPVERTYGVFIDRDLGPVRLSAELRQYKERGATALVRVGIRF